MDNVLRISPYLLHEPGHLLFADELWFLPIRYYCGSRLAIVAFHQEELELEVIEEFATLLDAVSFSARKEDRNGPVLQRAHHFTGIGTYFSKVVAKVVLENWLVQIF